MLLLFLLAGLGLAELVRLVAQGLTWVIRGDRERRASGRAGRSGRIDHRRSIDGDDARGGRRRTDARCHRRLRTGRPRTAASRIPRHGVRLIALTVLAAVAATVGLVLVQDDRGFIPYWARYNYTGYESGTDADASRRSRGPSTARSSTPRTRLAPGRMLWEGGDAIGAYGTPLALMLLPYWTDGRIASMEGLYFEASATTPYHFMTVATLAQSPSNPVRGLPYKNIADFDLGVRYLQLMGVRYYAAFSAEAKEKADANPDLQVVATVPDLDGKPPIGWTIYEVQDAPTVQALQYEPVVATGMHRRRRGSARACRSPPTPARTSPSSAPGSAPRCRGSPTPTRSTGRSPTTVPRRGQRAAGRERTHHARSRRCRRSTCRTSARPSRRSSSTCRGPACR